MNSIKLIQEIAFLEIEEKQQRQKILSLEKELIAVNNGLLTTLLQLARYKEQLQRFEEAEARVAFGKVLHT